MNGGGNSRPESEGSSSLRVVKLHSEADGSLVFRGTRGLQGAGLFFALFGLSGLLFGGWGAYFALRSDGSLAGAAIAAGVGLCFGVFAFVGFGVFKSSFEEISFDSQARMLRASGGFEWRPEKAKSVNEVPFDEIEAVETLDYLSEESSDSSYRSLQLTLLLKSGERIRLTNHAAIQDLKEEAQEIAQLLGVPLREFCD